VRSRRPLQIPAAMWGLVIAAVAVATYLVGVFSAAVLRLIGIDQGFSQILVWSSGAPLLLGLGLIALDAIILAPRRRGRREVFDEPVSGLEMTVVLTAYNDEASIGEAVDDFLDHPLAKRVLVIDNNSSDATAEVARAHGAIVHTEMKPGYGQCVHRALTEAGAYTDTELVALCEGDMTFRSADLDKLAAYTAHAHIVNGTRIVEQLRAPETQLTTFMFYGNFAVGKLLEFKHLGRGTISDVGTTFKVCRSEFLREHLDIFDPRVNLEFNAHFLDTVMEYQFRLVEVPITFYPRVGVSKGGNTSNSRAAKVGIRMMLGILFGWGWLKDRRDYGQS
jgi:glycosyltransferase involved in cell wall biosynthesis